MIFKQNISSSGLTKKADRRNIFHIRRFKNDHGFQVYTLDNTAEGNRIFIPRFIFGRFRASIRTLLKNEISKKQPEPFELTASFLNREYFYFKSSLTDLNNLIIQDIEEREGSSGYITVSRSSLQTLDRLLYDDQIQHPNDVLQEIISYHKLFQFSFVKGSKSITSGLALRKDVLQSTERYTPSLAQKIHLNEESSEAESEATKKPVIDRRKSKSRENALYKPKLGERFNEKDIKVNYDDVFSDIKPTANSASDSTKDNDKKSSKSTSILSQFPIPLETSEIKDFNSGKHYFELSTIQAGEFRERFINDRSCDFYLGFEIIDALFPFNRSIRTFQFPLYYTKVSIRESGRGVHIELKQDGLFYLNHLALAQLVDKFSETASGTDPVDNFFKTLLAQDISVDRLNDRIHLSRFLPVKEDIFDRTREILLGYQDENGKGGILSDLKVNGIECDLQSVFLYRAPKLLNPVDQALENDLDQISAIAHQSTRRFYNSLLGKFLTPEQESTTSRKNNFADITWMPGALPHSTRQLIDRLNHHELVLLEGPPGTGKTYSIMNLLIHCICNKQKILIVSDQKGAIEALVEKLQEYLIGNDRGTPAERKWKELLVSAIKVVDDVETGDQPLADLIENLSNAFNVLDPGPGTASSGDNIEKKIKQIGESIEKLKASISRKMHDNMSDDTPFNHRVIHKEDTNNNIASLIEFLDSLQGKNKKRRPLLEAFIENRLSLINEHMSDCYDFFKIPVKNFDNEVKVLNDDIKILSLIIEMKPRTIEEFHNITRDYPRHEIIRYLEATLTTLTSKHTNTIVNTLIKIKLFFTPPLQSRANQLLKSVQDQVQLLKISDKWSSELWELLRDLHESIRLGEEPNLVLNLYNNISTDKQGASIQGDLDQMDDLFSQQDKLVRDRLIENLRDIVQSASASKRGSGTSNITSIFALTESLKQFSSISESGSVFNELRQVLFDTFPIWLVRKQVVPFLLPCTEQSFDLVIVDEATQCRVDDAMSLMYRAKKILVVGDDKQTVLQKNSVIDDYLFKDHELDEHLRSTQARGFKGGGSHIFALIKSIKQASVMLDEHYRCPASIIEFSNKYVYENGLNIMQWKLPDTPASVVVNYSEQDKTSSKKATSGKFKGIETEMIDRFFDYMITTIKQIEKTTGKKINVETDVAICYFLLKNEPYVKHVKDKFLKTLNRGEDILDGAGAALQGNERDYIFYLWDITRYNIGSFKQGDDATKRKGELNVLMSRPKKIAFHFLHRNFDQLEHNRTNITNYLWRANIQHERTINQPVQNRSPLHDSLLGSLLSFTVNNSSNRSIKQVRNSVQNEDIDFRENIIVGDAGRSVDLISFPACNSQNVIGIVDLSGFGNEKNTGQIVVDYYFQLKRVTPGIDPVFVFPHELVDENGQSFRSLMQKLEHIGDS